MSLVVVSEFNFRFPKSTPVFPKRLNVATRRSRPPHLCKQCKSSHHKKPGDFSDCSLFQLLVMGESIKDVGVKRESGKLIQWDDSPAVTPLV
jgi:hypothetical protein